MFLSALLFRGVRISLLSVLSLAMLIAAASTPAQTQSAGAQMLEQQLQQALAAADFEAALATSTELLRLRLQRLGPTDFSTLDAWRAVGQAYGLLGDTSAARLTLIRVATTTRALVGANNNDPDKTAASADANAVLVRTLQQLALWTAVEQGAAPALPMQQEAYERAARLYGDDVALTQYVALDLGGLQLQAGQVESGCALLTRIQTAVSRQSAPSARLLAATETATARCRLATQQAPAAFVLLQQAAQRQAALSSVEQRNLLGLQARAAWLAGQRGQARSLLTRFSGETAAATSLPIELSQWLGLADQEAALRLLARMHVESDEADAALAVMETLRTQQAQAQLLTQQAPAGMSQADAERWHRLDAALTQAERRIAAEERTASAPASRIQDETQRADALLAKRRFARELADKSLLLTEAFASPATAARVTPLAAARVRRDMPLMDLNWSQRLPAGVTLVTYQRAEERWWATVTARDLPTRLLWLDDPALSVLAAAWPRLLRTESVRLWAADSAAINGPVLTTPPGKDRPATELNRASVGERLAATLLAPVLAVAPATRHLVVVADDVLLTVPFDALPWRDASALQRWLVSYAPSLTDYLEVRQRAVAPMGWRKDLLAVASDEPPSSADARGEERDELAAVARPFVPSRMQRALADAPTAQAVMQLLRESSSDGTLIHYHWVHLLNRCAAPAAPAAANSPPAQAMNSLAEAPPAALHPGQLAALQMSASVLTLTSCTRVLSAADAQAIPLLAQAAFIAGNHRALFMLWPVEARIRARFMQRFYARLVQGSTPAAALTQIKREFARSDDPRERDVRSWAAFVLYGS